MLLAVDPSVRSPGVALFDGVALIAAARLNCKRVISASDGQHWLDVALTIVAWCQATNSRGRIHTLVYERPQIYTWSKSKGDPNDLIGLAGVGSAVAGLLHCDVLSPTPAQWIGQLPKATKGSAKDSPRAQRILSRLSPAELELVPNQHDAIDSVGLGLWSVGRLEPRHAFSNGR